MKNNDIDYNSELSNLTPNEILTILSNDNKLSGNPYQILKAINTFNSPKFSDLSESNNEIIDMVGSYDYLTKLERNTIKYDKDSNIYDILDDLINQETDINAITFNEDHENIFELEDPDYSSFDNLINNDFVLEKDIPQCIKDSNKKIGSVKQKTIEVFKLYNNRNLLYKDEAEELFLLARNKLLIYWDIIIDFEGVNVSDVFLKYSIGDLCQWLTPQEILQRVTISNIEDDIYVNFFKNTLQNSYKFWINQKGILEQNIALDKLDLYQTLTNEKISLGEFRPTEELADKNIPFEFISAQFLGKKREKKLRYPVYFVEKITKEVILKYNIDQIIYDYISTLIDHNINWSQVDINNKQTLLNDKYKLQFGIEEFRLIYEFTQSVLLNKCYDYLDSAKNDIMNIKNEIKEIKDKLPDNILDKVSFHSVYLDNTALKSIPDHIRFKFRRLEELEFALMDLEHKYFIKEDILKNIFEIVSFSMYKTGLDKVKLIAYHYLTSYLEIISKDYWEKLPSKKIRGHLTLIEIFRFELVSILQEDTNLKKFVFTIKELIMKWVFKYTQTTPIAKVYFDFLMITPELLTELILRYIALIAIKNKNPMTLRAIYSSYISLIHTAIYLNINNDVYDRSYGFFGALDNLRDKENNQNNFLVKNKDTIYINSIIRAFMLKNPRLLNENYHLIKRLGIQPMLELDSLRLHATKPKEIPTHNWYFYYTKYFQYMDNENTLKIKSKFLKSDKRNNQYKYICIITHETLREPLYKRIKDYECVDIILDGICEDISMRTINRGYMDENLNIKVVENNDYFNNIYKLLNDIKLKLEE